MQETIHLPEGSVLTVTAHERVVVSQIQDSTIGGSLADGSVRSFGPYPLGRDFLIGGNATTIVAEANAAAPVSVKLSASQINHLNSSPVELIAAPGAGKMLRLINAQLIYTVGSVTYYTDSSIDHPEIHLGGLALANLLGGGSFGIDAVADTIYEFAPSNQALVRSACENQPLTLGNSYGDLIGYGDVTVATVSAGGSGYAVGNTGTISAGFSFAAPYTVTGVDGGGAVTSFTFSGLNGMAAGDIKGTAVVTGGGDGAFSVEATTIVPGNGTATVLVKYEIVDLT